MTTPSAPGIGPGPAASAQRFVLAAPSGYETVAAGQTNQVLGGAGAVGDHLATLLIVPAAANCGIVQIKDGAGAAITVFAGGGTVALPTLAPISVPIGLISTAGAWQVTTGANVSVLASGDFTA